MTGSLMATLMAGTAAADTLREALVSAYQTNPTLTAQREDLRGDRRQCRHRQGGGAARRSVATVGLNRDLSSRRHLSRLGQGPGGLGRSRP